MHTQSVLNQKCLHLVLSQMHLHLAPSAAQCSDFLPALSAFWGLTMVLEDRFRAHNSCLQCQEAEEGCQHLCGGSNINVVVGHMVGGEELLHEGAMVCQVLGMGAIGNQSSN